MPDWNKEIKVSDLFGHSKKSKEPKASKKPKEQVAEAAAAPVTEAAGTPVAPAEKKSLLKKEINLSLRRKERAPKAPKAAEAPQDAGAAQLSRAERRAAKQEARAAAKAEKQTRRKAPRESRHSRREAPPPGAVPLMRAFNLLPRDDVREARGRRLKPAQLVLAVVALVALAALGAYFLMLQASVADKRAEADSLRAAAAASPNPAAPPPAENETNTQLQQEQEARTVALASALGRRVAWDRLLREFSLVVPDDVSLTKMTAAGGAGAADPAAPAGTPPPESTFTLEGYTQSQESVARLLARLAVLPELSAVDLESSTATQLGPSKTRVFQFVIRTIVKPVSGSTL